MCSPRPSAWRTIFGAVAMALSMSAMKEASLVSSMMVGDHEMLYTAPERRGHGRRETHTYGWGDDRRTLYVEILRTHDWLAWVFVRCVP
mmetsp:Transcript_30116/g.87444  ORF Transcript_30116/g.87444 Transcript_30116/m.87444 type:complete len:89 (-) Transcript_30116:628-894(-)